MWNTVRLHLLQLLAVHYQEAWVKYARQGIASLRVLPKPQRRGRWLLVDVSIFAMHDAGTGIQRVVRSVAIELLRAPPDGFEVKLVRATRKQGYRHVELQCPVGEDDRLQLQTLDLPVNVQCGDIFLGLDFCSRIVPARLRELLSWRQIGVKCAFVVYDLIPALYPQWFTKNGRRNYQKWLRSISIHADMLCCISNAVADDARHWISSRFDICDGEINFRWFYLGASFGEEVVEPIQPVVMRVGGSEVALARSLLMVGTVEPRKGHDQVLGAVEELWQRGFDVVLVVAGRQGWNVESFASRLRAHPENGKRIIWLEDVSDSQLGWLYKNLGGLVMASMAEGFGLPLVEAMHHGMPILARDLPVFREIAGESASYFYGDNPIELADRILEWINDSESKRAPATDRTRLLNWRESTNWLIRHLNELA
ncbi:glycosyl transferase family 1 [Burkholderia sp. AU33803]|uniref:glycosyltransferase family 4 protein n=1 Tax=Burkholderia sp. AU33803 TaxID=2015357 RepID=UPI000B7AA0F0|nr:glycosyltransferase family 1 protein [Burkholderia sp. AU33803]OXJ02098.1 glycosyl transferase family 1 [Burkholderia sp. AU33803]PRD97017.1 glycosyltransferase family 1 protein [Burkholderia contaminans]